MKLRMPLILGAVVTSVILGAAAPASAADTATTFELTGGTLALSVQASAALTSEASGIAANTITGTLGAVAVTDNRGGVAEWNVTAASTTFTGTGLSVSDSVTYTGGVVTETGSITVDDGTAKALTGVAISVVAPTVLSGNNTASWNPTLDVAMPVSALAGSYSGTVTTSVA